TKEVQKLIEEEFGVSYSSWQVRRILKSFEIRQTVPEELQEAR
ncbi:MAG: winged helix-turn-helix domain-containing protein, partial [Candidatus Syntropharchaeia archaeon]